MKPSRCAIQGSCTAAGQGSLGALVHELKDFIPIPMPATPTPLQAAATAHNPPARICGMQQLGVR